MPQPQLQRPLLLLHILHSIIQMGPGQRSVYGVAMNVPWYMQPYGMPAHPSAPPSQHPHLTYGSGIAATQPPLWSYTAPLPTPVPNAIEV